jgi:phosphatidylserine/phosphatidylglycerophosphate/cardiolipin synthase-like enzyme
MSRVLQPGRNCWRIERANRFALLVDASNYYGALIKAMLRAQRSIALLAWDLDTRTQLFENDPRHGTGPLREFLRDIVSRNPNLHAYVLPWNFSVLFANVRDPKLVLGQDPFEHPRIHFKMDDVHPPGGSHHQKIVVVDDKLAFAGGMDLAGGRWDTPEHRAKDPRRANAEESYPPSHDVQGMVDGDAAAALAEIVRERWHRAAGTSIPKTEGASDPWPEGVPADLTNVDIAISRTDPLISCREVEPLHLDLIAAARESLYIENQYLTSPRIVDALSRRLQEADGPEIVVVIPLDNAGWLENHTIEVLRFRQVRRLRAADRFRRLRICYPTVRGLQDESIVVHSKILAVDNRLFRVGSSNLTERSMRLDTECDLTLEAGDERQQTAIARLRNRLLGEHLGLTAETVQDRLSGDRSLIRLIDSCSSQSRCLRELPDDGQATQILSDALIDPPQPLTPAFVLRTIADAAARNKWCWAIAGVAAGIILGKLTANRSR